MGMKMDTIFLDDFVDGGIIRESSFRKKVKSINWESYKDKDVLIKGCASVEVPTWAYMIITVKLSSFAKKILFGEPCSAVKIL